MFSIEEKFWELLEMSKSNMLGVLELMWREWEIFELFVYMEYNIVKKVVEKLSISFRIVWCYINNVNCKVKMIFLLNNFINI